MAANPLAGAAIVEGTVLEDGEVATALEQGAPPAAPVGVVGAIFDPESPAVAASSPDTGLAVVLGRGEDKALHADAANRAFREQGDATPKRPAMGPNPKQGTFCDRCVVGRITAGAGATPCMCAPPPAHLPQRALSIGVAACTTRCQGDAQAALP
jgi:hypothetical protein